MINPDNQKDIECFMNYRANVLQNDPATVRCRRHELEHLLEWAGNNFLANAKAIEPAFPIYLLTDRRDGKNKPLSPKSLSKITEGSRMFIAWATLEYPAQYGNIPPNWIKSIRPRRAKGLQSETKINLHWSLEDVRKIAGLQLTNLADIRDRAAICFLYLSGMRVTAFVSIPIMCVDLDRLKIEQLPSKGVRTKNHKAAITSLLPIADLLNVVKSWDTRIRAELSLSAPWYVKLTSEGMHRYTSGFVSGAGSDHGRREALVEGMRRLCSIAKVDYLSPHKLRHGHAVYGIKNAKNVEQLKAVSQNLMHSSLENTDGIYGNLVEDDVRKGIASLGNVPISQAGDIPTQLMQAMVKLINNPDLAKLILNS